MVRQLSYIVYMYSDRTLIDSKKKKDACFVDLPWVVCLGYVGKYSSHKML